MMKREKETDNRTVTETEEELHIINGGDRPYDTTPQPDAVVKGWQRWRKGMYRSASAILTPMVQRFARDQIGGETVDDAICVAQRLAVAGFPNTLGFWPIGNETAQEVTNQYVISVKALAASGLDGYLSIKPPAVCFDARLAIELATFAHAQNVRLHCDSHGIESVDPSHQLIESLLSALSPADVGTTLPGRWSRSLEDADWAIERGLSVRVVKGQWPDPADPERDMRLGFLELIDRLAGRARHIAVATHDIPLIEEATARLRAAGSSYEVEVISNALMIPVQHWVQQHDIPLRAYIPYGKGFLPNAISQLRRNPRLMWYVLKGMATWRTNPGQR